MAIGNAVDFQSAIGIQRKEARLRYLKDYWMGKAARIPRVCFHTSAQPKHSCGIASFSVDGWNGNEVCDALFETKKTFVTPIQYEKLNCVRVSPNLYNSTWELDRLVEGIAEIASSAGPRAGGK
jgi:selenocysteine lyase/cysteine desulfurase